MMKKYEEKKRKRGLEMDLKNEKKKINTGIERFGQDPKKQLQNTKKDKKNIITDIRRIGRDQISQLQTRVPTTRVPTTGNCTSEKKNKKGNKLILFFAIAIVLIVVIGIVLFFFISKSSEEIKPPSKDYTKIIDTVTKTSLLEMPTLDEKFETGSPSDMYGVQHGLAGIMFASDVTKSAAVDEYKIPLLAEKRYDRVSGTCFVPSYGDKVGEGIFEINADENILYEQVFQKSLGPIDFDVEIPESTNFLNISYTYISGPDYPGIWLAIANAYVYGHEEKEVQVKAEE